MHGLTWAMYAYFRWASPVHTPAVHFWTQFKAIGTNFVLLPIVQVGFDALQEAGYTKATMGNTDLFSAVRDACLWMLCFEWAWYFQHRAMHDNKFLWTLGHSYHHSWRKPEHMIGVTNFAFDHIVEVWVTMSSSFLGYLLFPANFFVGKAVSLFYMVLAVAAHWDGSEMSRYHLNHHYLVRGRVVGARVDGSCARECTCVVRFLRKTFFETMENKLVFIGSGCQVFCRLQSSLHPRHCNFYSYTHSQVTKNYGSHIPMFDMLFGTYQWDAYVHPLSHPPPSELKAAAAAIAKHAAAVEEHKKAKAA